MEGEIRLAATRGLVGGAITSSQDFTAYYDNINEFFVSPMSWKRISLPEKHAL